MLVCLSERIAPGYYVAGMEARAVHVFSVALSIVSTAMATLHILQYQQICQHQFMCLSSQGLLGDIHVLRILIKELQPEYVHCLSRFAVLVGYIGCQGICICNKKIFSFQNSTFSLSL